MVVCGFATQVAVLHAARAALQSGDRLIIHLDEIDWCDPACRAFADAAVENGIPVNKDYNGRNPAGARKTSPG